MIFYVFLMIFDYFQRRQYPGSTPAVPQLYHGVSGSSGAVFGGPEAKNSPILNYGSVRHLCELVSISTPQGNIFLYNSTTIWAARSHDWYRLFLGSRSAKEASA